MATALKLNQLKNKADNLGEELVDILDDLSAVNDLPSLMHTINATTGYLRYKLDLALGLGDFRNFSGISK